MSDIRFSSELTADASHMNAMERSLASASVMPQQAFLQTSGGYDEGAVTRYRTSRGGVFGSPADYLESKNLRPSVSGGGFLIEAGAALDTSGRIITIPVQLNLAPGGSSANYAWPSTDTGEHYVKLRYLETTTDAKVDDSGTPQVTRGEDSYYISVDFADTALDADEIMIASVFVNADVAQSATDYRNYVQPLVQAVGAFVDPTLNPVVELPTLQDHVSAIGTGTPSATNPHGLAPSDVGATRIEDVMLWSTFTGLSSSLDFVNQNTGNSTIFVQALVRLTQGVIYEENTTQSLSLYASPSGSLAPPSGSIVTPYELSRATLQHKVRTAGYYSLQAPLVGWIPSQWYFTVSRTVGVNLGTQNAIVFFVKSE